MDSLPLYGNRFCFEDLYRWIDDRVHHPSAYMDRNSCLVLIGPPGIGKTYGLEKVCEDLGVHIKKIDSANCHSIKELADLFVKMASTNLQDVIQQTVRKNVLFIDEFEILIQLDRNIPSSLYQLISADLSKKKPLPYMPVVIACNDNMEKKLGDIRRFCKTIHLKPPTEADVLLMLRAYSQLHRLNVPGEVILHISESVSGNMQQALQMLQIELLRSNGEGMDTTIDSMPDIHVLYQNPSRKVAYQLFGEDAWMNPLRFHENLPKEMDMRKGTRQKKDLVYSRMLRCMLDWDAMVNRDDECLDIAMTHLCNAPCYFLPQLERKKRAEDASMNEFTKTLSQMSLQCKLKRHTYKDSFPWAHVGNYCYTIKKKKFSDVDTDT